MTTDEVSELRSQIDDLSAQLDELRGEMLRAQVDQWEARIDALEVQLHLGSLDARERMEPLVEQLRNRWLDAKEEFNHTGIGGCRRTRGVTRRARVRDARSARRGRRIRACR